MAVPEHQKSILKAAEEFHYQRGMTIADLCMIGAPGLTGDPATTLEQVKELEAEGYLYRGNPRFQHGAGDYAFPWFITQKGHDLVVSGVLR